MSNAASGQKGSRKGLGKLFRKDEAGATALIFALSALVLLTVVFGAVDLNRINQARTRLRDALDTATLAAALTNAKDDKALDAAGDDYLRTQVRDSADLKNVKGDFVYNGEAVKAQASADVDPLILDLVFHEPLRVKVDAVAQKSSDQKLELALVLDTTASMAGSKISTLQTAAKNLVQTLTTGSGKNDAVKIAIAPFGQYVNVGVSRRNLPWMNVAADFTEPVTGTCTTQTSTTTCDTQTYACTKYNDGVPYQSTCSKSINCKTTPLNPPKKTCTKDSTASYKWYGCVGSPTPYPANIQDTPNKYPGIFNTTCGAEITPLTSAQGTLVSSISSLKATGDTYIPAGLLWGWNLLSYSSPMTEGAPYDTSGKNLKPRKALVLMTDGANSMKMETTAGNAGAIKQPAGRHSSIGGAVPTQANQYSRELCDNIKAAKIEVFTVAFAIDDPVAKDLVKNCATDSKHYFDAQDEAALLAAFASIGRALQPLYLSH